VHDIISGASSKVIKTGILAAHCYSIIYSTTILINQIFLNQKEIGKKIVFFCCRQTLGQVSPGTPVTPRCPKASQTRQKISLALINQWPVLLTYYYHK